MDKHTFSREELYNLVWSVPLLTLAKKYAISDVGLRKTCIRMNIPLPKTGHWQKLQFGKKVRMVPLPGNYKGVGSVSLAVRDTITTAPLKGESPLSVLKRQIEAETPAILMVPERLSKPDKLILSARASLTAQKADDFLYKGTVSCSGGELDIRVSRGNIGRALRFLDTLIKALKARGHRVEIRSGTTYVTVGEEEFKMRFREKMRKEIQKQGSWDSTVFYPAGILSLQMGYCSPGEWKDGKVPLEMKLSQIIAQLELSAKEWKEKRIKWEIEADQRKDREHLQREFEKRQEDELNHFRDMLSNATRWQKADHLRLYIGAVEREARAGNGVSQELEDWLMWARKKADWYDPLVEAEDELLHGVDRDTLTLPKRSTPFW
jgi:hypothetical protein